MQEEFFIDNRAEQYQMNGALMGLVIGFISGLIILNGVGGAIAGGVVGLFGGAMLGTVAGKMSPAASRTMIGTILVVLAFIILQNLWQDLSRYFSPVDPAVGPVYDETYYLPEE